VTVELRPLGVKCNIQCRYCYQEPQRDARNLVHGYDIERMKAGILREGGPFSLFGGEPLLVPLRDLEDLWSWGYQHFGRNSVQTNGVLITDAHIELFKRYRVGVGISLDGPGELNDVRWHGSLQRTRRSTARTESAIARLCAEGMPPSLIITLHRSNACRDRLPQLLDWIASVDSVGVRSARLHLLESESEEIRRTYALTDDENIAALLALAELQTRLVQLSFDVFPDMYRMMTAHDRDATCIWQACDPYTTRAVRGVEGQGQSSNCGRTNKDGIDFLKSTEEGYERYLALYHTPQAAGGCHGCRFFLMCKGQCPGTAIDGDWRNRTEHCGVWMTLYDHLEREMVSSGESPLSLHPRRAEIEQQLLSAWAVGKNISVGQAVATIA
jgi:uncharacterized protein